MSPSIAKYVERMWVRERGVMFVAPQATPHTTESNIYMDQVNVLLARVVGQHSMCVCVFTQWAVVCRVHTHIQMVYTRWRCGRCVYV